ncbi:MAG: hypothetical protein KJ017_09655 [Alphaproteobacteria bacterium]|nr:hypothetical protein [Alphaproteobacteria bacterium]
MRLIGLLFFLNILSACAVPMQSQEMMPQFDFYDSVSPEKYKDSIFVRNIEIKKGVGGSMPVTPEEYRSALVSSLRQADLYAPQDKATYALDAFMSEMKQPMIGFNLTVNTTTEYKIYKASDNSLEFSESVTVPCTKGMGDAFDGAIRLRMASGCSVGENITHAIKLISQN